MVKRIVLAVVLMAIGLIATDYVIHGLILAEDYAATAQLWRPQEEMLPAFWLFSVLVWSVAFVMIYALLITPKTVLSGLRYGWWLGLALGVSFGFGMYAVMPLTEKIVVTWCLGITIQFLLAGLLVGLLVRPSTDVSQS
jgi:hypothetical protein